MASEPPTPSRLVELEISRSDDEIAARPAIELSSKSPVVVHAADPSPRVIISSARIVKDPDWKFGSREWLKFQVLQVSWANVALAVALLLLSTQLTSQQKQINDQLLTLNAAQANLTSQVSTANQLLTHLNDQATDLQMINQTATQLIRLGVLDFTQLLRNLSIIDSPHYVGDSNSGLGAVFLNGWTTPTDQPVRFWIDRKVVHLEGILNSGINTGNAIAFQLPTSYCPTHGRSFAVVTTSFNSAGTGVVSIEGSTTASKPDRACGLVLTTIAASYNLDGITFLLD